MERGRWPRGVAVSARPSAAYRTSAEQAVVHHLHAVVRPLLLQYGYEQHASLGCFISALHSDGVCLSQLDAELLAEVSRVLPRARPFVLPPRLSDAEGIAHGGMVEAIGPEAIWNEYRREADTSGSDCHGRPNPAGGGLWLKGVQVMVVRSERYIMLPATPRRGRAGPSRCSFRAYRRHSSL